MYEQTRENNTVIPRLKYILHAEGMIDMATATPQYQYYLKDHLGNTRVVVSSDNTAQQITNYYAFGLTSQSYQSGTSNKYLYNGKELQDDLIAGRTLDWLDYGARMYDAALGRWHSIDPLSGLYRDLSPYNYSLNSPIVFLDPDGRSVEHYYGEEAQEWLRRNTSGWYEGDEGDEGDDKKKSEKKIETVDEYDYQQRVSAIEGRPWYSIYNWPGLAPSAQTMDAIYAEDYWNATGWLLVCVLDVFTWGRASTINYGSRATSTAVTTSRNVAAKGVSVMTDLSKRFPGFEPLVTRIGGSASKSEIYPALQKIAKGDWIKVYQGGHINGKATEIHFYLHKASGQIANPKIKYSRQMEKLLKDLGY